MSVLSVKGIELRLSVMIRHTFLLGTLKGSSVLVVILSTVLLFIDGRLFTSWFRERCVLLMLGRQECNVHNNRDYAKSFITSSLLLKSLLSFLSAVVCTWVLLLRIIPVYKPPIAFNGPIT